MTFRHTQKMGEISGFGGGYEKTCQDMLEAGCLWLQQKPNADLTAGTYKDVFGIFDPKSDDAKALSDHVTSVTDDCTGAMHHAVMSRLFYIAKNGWEKYKTELEKREASQ